MWFAKKLLYGITKKFLITLYMKIFSCENLRCNQFTPKNLLKNDNVQENFQIAI